MIKLNNKGFAVSTILYGILALTIIILMLIFGIMKSNKDMNQDLVSSIEEDINKCTLSEVELENCYFSNGACDTKEYYSCIGKKEEENLLYDIVEIGDFVNYDAGAWTSTIPKPDLDNLFVFGGYTAGNSKNKTLIDGGYDGWRVIYKKDSYVYLIHAGIPEYFSFTALEDDKTIYNFEKIITGVASGEYNEGYNSTPKNWKSDYLNSDYAEDVRNINFDDLKTWIDQSSENYKDSNLINVGETYLFSNINFNRLEVDIFDSYGGDFSSDNRGVYGVRPIVKLKQGVKTSGSVSNTYGKKEWILVK